MSNLECSMYFWNTPINQKIGKQNNFFTRIKLLLNQTLKAQCIQRWTSKMINSSRGHFYFNFKTNSSFENYLTRLSENNRIWITKLRTCNRKFPTEM